MAIIMQRWSGQFGEYLVGRSWVGSSGADLGRLLFTMLPRRYLKQTEAVEVGWLGSAAATFPARAHFFRTAVTQPCRSPIHIRPVVPVSPFSQYPT